MNPPHRLFMGVPPWVALVKQLSAIKLMDEPTSKDMPDIQVKFSITAVLFSL